MGKSNTPSSHNFEHNGSGGCRVIPGSRSKVKRSRVKRSRVRSTFDLDLTLDL